MRKFEKLFGAVVLSAAMVLGSVAVPGQQAKVQAYNNKAKAAYEAYMGKDKNVSVEYINGYNFENAQTGKFETKEKSINLKKFIHYVFQDINQDGTPELLVSNRRKSIGCGTVLVCTYKDGKVCPVICVAGIRDGLYNAKGNKLCVRFGASTDDTYTFLKFNGTEMKHVITFRDEHYHVKGGKMVHHYFKNGQKIKKAGFNKGKAMVTTKVEL